MESSTAPVMYEAAGLARKVMAAAVSAGSHALLAAQQGLVFMGRTGLDIDKLTATARSLAAQLLPGT